MKNHLDHGTAEQTAGCLFVLARHFAESVARRSLRLLLLGAILGLGLGLPMTAQAQSTLVPGDIAFVRMNEDNVDAFSFVALVDLAPGTVVYFAERGWLNTTWIGNTESHLKYTAPAGGLPAGSVVHVDETAADVLTVTGSGTVVFAWGTSAFNLASGDQVLAYQTTSATLPTAAANLTFIAGITLNDGNGASADYYNDPTTHWTVATYANTGGTATNKSTLPPGLTNGLNCLSVFPDFNVLASQDNVRYNNSVTTGTRAQLLAAISNAANWVYDDITNYPTSSVGPFTVTSLVPEIEIQGNGTTIIDGDTTPAASDHTDFGTTPVAGGSVVRTLTIRNTGTGALTLGGSPRVAVSGIHAADFTVTTQPAASVAAGGSSTFQVTFDPSASGTRTASLSIINTDADENPYNFSIQGVGTAPTPEIYVQGNSVTILDEDSTPSAADHTEFGSADSTTGSVTRTFAIRNQGEAALSLTGTPRVAVGGANPADFVVAVQPAASVAVGGATDFQVTFNPTATGLRSATLSIANNDSDENPYNFAIQGTGTSMNLAAGAIAFIGYNSDDPDGFAFIALSDLPPTEQIYFTDEGWSDTAWNGSPSEAHVSWTAPAAGLPIGSIVRVYESATDTLTASAGTVSGVLVGTVFHYSSGDQVLAYQSATGADPATPQFVAGLHADYQSDNYDVATGWSATGNSDSTSRVPAGLANAVNCVALFPATTERHNAKYTGTLTGSADALRAAINDYRNWSFADTPYAIAPSDFATPVVTYSPEIEVVGNGSVIVAGDTTSTIVDHTNFLGATLIGQTVSRTFTIRNLGAGSLILGGTPRIALSGTDAAAFAITTAPAAAVAAGANTTFTITFTPARTGPHAALVRIANNDTNENPYEFAIAGATAPALSIADVAVDEGNSGATTCRFTVSLAYATEQDVFFDIATADGTAAAADGDYTPKSLANQVIPAGAISFAFDVLVIGDVAIEPDQTFFANLFNVVGTTVGDAQATGTIRNEDTTVYTYDDWTVMNFSIAEQADPAISGLTADPDGTGYPNLLRYALGLPARGHFASPVATNVVGNTATMTFPVRAFAVDLQSIVQSSTDLVTWSDVQSYLSTAAPQNIVRAVPAPGGAARFFVRLKVVRTEP